MSLEKELAKIYANANDLAMNRAEKYIKSFTNQYKKELAEAKALTGKYAGLTPAQAESGVKNWLNGKFDNKGWKGTRREMARILTDADHKAALATNAEMREIFTAGAMKEARTLQNSISRTFTIYNKEAVKRLDRKAKMLPKVKIRDAKATAWHEKQIQKCIQSGIMQGRSIDTLAEQISTATNMSYNQSVRSARTAMTGAQNAGRQESYEECARQGIEIEKEWMSWIDDNTRDSHAEMDGERVPYDEEFSNGLMYPGDPHGDPSEVWNCRCTMRAIIKGVND